jgi:hypothetical protein
MRSLPVKARIVVIAAVGAGMVCLVARLGGIGSWNGFDAATFLFLTAGITLAEQFQIPIRFRTETLNLSLTEALWVGALILGHASVVTVAVACGVLLGQSMRRWSPHKVAFNAGQFLVSLTVAQVVFAALRGPGPFRPMTFVAAVVAMAAYALVNATSVATIISLAEQRSFGSVLLPPLRTNALHFATNTALGIVAAIVWSVNSGAVIFLVLPLALAFLAYRTLLEDLRENEQVRDLFFERVDVA